MPNPTSQGAGLCTLLIELDSAGSHPPLFPLKGEKILATVVGGKTELVIILAIVAFTFSFVSKIKNKQYFFDWFFVDKSILSSYALKSCCYVKERRLVPYTVNDGLRCAKWKRWVPRLGTMKDSCCQNCVVCTVDRNVVGPRRPKTLLFLCKHKSGESGKLKTVSLEMLLSSVEEKERWVLFGCLWRVLAICVLVMTLIADAGTPVASVSSTVPDILKK